MPKGGCNHFNKKGLPCKNPPLKGSDLCFYHSQFKAILPDKDNPISEFTNGKSRYVKIFDDYQTLSEKLLQILQSDPVASLRDDIALARGILEEFLQRYGAHAFLSTNNLTTLLNHLDKLSTLTERYTNLIHARTDRISATQLAENTFKLAKGMKHIIQTYVPAEYQQKAADELILLVEKIDKGSI